MIEGSGSLTNGSGSGRPKNIWTLLILIRNTNPLYIKTRLPDSGSTLVYQLGEDGLHIVQEEILESLLVLRVADHEEDLALPLRQRFPADGNV